MAVFRVEKNKNYTTMANYHFLDKSLSWKAKGILSNMLSLPNDWDYSLAGLATLSSDGMSATRTAIKELEEHGYLIRRPIRKDGKISDWEYVIFEYPQTENQDVEKLLVENQQVENHTQLNTKEQITKKSNTKEIKERKQNSFDDIFRAYTSDEKTLELLGEWLKVRKAKRAALTDRAIQMNVDKLDVLAKASGMSVNDYLSEVICRGWAAFYEIKSFGYNNSAAQLKVINGKEYEFRGGKYYIPNGNGVAVDPYAKDDLPY